MVGISATSCSGISHRDVPDPISDLNAPILITDKSRDAVLSLDLSTGESEWVVELGSRAVMRPSALLCRGGSLFLAAFGSGEILRIDSGSGSMVTPFFHDRRLLEEPVALVMHRDSLLVLGNDTGNVVSLDAQGEAMFSFGYPELGSPHDMIKGADGLLYVATSTPPERIGTVQVWNPDTRVLLASFGSTGDLDEASALLFDKGGTLLVADAIGGRVVRFASDGRLLDVVSDELERPLSMALGLDGDLYLLDDRTVLRLDPSSGGLVASYDLSDELIQPRDIAFHTLP